MIGIINKMTTKFFTTNSFLNTINTQLDLYTPLVMTKHISSAIHLAELMYLDLPEKSLIKLFIDEVKDQPAKITGFVNSNYKLESKVSSVFDLNNNT